MVQETQEPNVRLEWQNKLEDEFPNGFLAMRAKNKDTSATYHVLNAWVVSVQEDMPTLDLILAYEPGGGKVLRIEVSKYEEKQSNPRVVQIITPEDGVWLFSGNLSPELAKEMKATRVNRPGDEPAEEDKPILDRNDLDVRQKIGKLLLGE